MKAFPVFRWLAPSAACASAGAIVAGLYEGFGMSDAIGAIAAAGFLALVVAPILFVGSVIVRLLYFGWRPDELAASMVEPGGAAPRLAGWVATIWLGCFAIAWVASRSVELIAEWTELTPMVLSFALPAILVASGMIGVIVAVPTARLLTAAARKLNARWLRPPLIFAAAIVLAIATTLVLWFVLVKPRIGPFDTSFLVAPVLAVVICIVAHAAWSKLRVRVIAGAITGLATAGAIATALVSVRARPDVTLEVWGDQPLAGFAIDLMFDIDRIRADISLAEFRPVDKPGAAHPDIILVTIDTMRADFTPPYGGAAEMPTLQKLGERGTVFEWAFSPSNVTRRSIPSMVIGLSPDRVRGRVVGWALRVDPRHVLLAERLRAGGYETAGFMCCDGFWGEKARTGLSRGLGHVVIEPSGLKLARAARDWLDQRERRPDRKPLFLWMHILEPHNWLAGYAEPQNDDDRRRMYSRSLTSSDTMLLHVLGAFSNRTPENAPITIVTADHGESLGEHGAPYHSTDLYNSQLRVPFVIAGPGIKAHRITETVSLTDLTPTIVELAGFELPNDTMDGRSLADLATGRRPHDPEGGTAFAAMIKDRSNPGGITTLIRGRYKLIDNGVTLELYDLRADPNEKTNLINERPAIAAELKKLLAAKLALGSPF